MHYLPKISPFGAQALHNLEYLVYQPPPLHASTSPDLAHHKVQIKDNIGKLQLGATPIIIEQLHMYIQDNPFKGTSSFYCKVF